MKGWIDKYLRGDRSLWIIAGVLAAISLVAVYSSISTLAVNKHGGNTEYYLFKQLLFLGIGFLAMFQAHKLKYTYYSKLSMIFVWLAVVLLGITLLKGSNINNANRWLTIPVINQSFQTSDFAKIALILYVSRILSIRRNEVRDYRRVLVPAMLAIGLVCGLILPANFSTAALLFITCLVLLFIGNVPVKQLLAVVGAGVLAFFLLIQVAASKPEILPRMATWKSRIMNFGVEKPGVNYQVEHAKIAIASGGLFPNGPGKGVSRNFLPHPYSDMIYAFIIEEYGTILGGLLLMILYLAFFLRSIRIALKCEKPFGAYVASGLSLMLTAQAFVNMGVAVNLFPVTGQPLPLVSMGGTSTLFTCLAIGIILSVSRSNEEQVEKANREPSTATHEHRPDYY